MPVPFIVFWYCCSKQGGSPGSRGAEQSSGSLFDGELLPMMPPEHQEVRYTVYGQFLGIGSRGATDVTTQEIMAKISTNLLPN